MAGARILIVEDETIVSQDIQRRLKELGYAIAGAAVSGEQAIQQAEATRPDLVLMDIQLKGEMDGTQAAQYIHQRFDLPVVYLTAHSDEATLQRAKITEPFGYILKPFEERELHTNIEMALYKHKLEQELRWQASVNAALAALGKALISPMSLDDISAIVLERAKQLTGSAFGFVGYIDPKTGHFVSSTMTRDIWDACQVADKSVIFTKFSGLWGWVLQNRQSLITNTPSHDPRSGGIPQGHVPIERFLGAPAMLDNNLVGMIALANPPRDYTERDLAVAERLAALYAVAIQRARMEHELEEWNRTLEQRVIERTEQLRQSEARVRHLYENSPVMMHTTDENDIICDVNAQWLQETGYSREQVVGRNIYAFMTPESAERYMEIQARLQRASGVRDVPYQFIMKSGTVMDVLVNTETTHDPSGQLISLSVVRNVTEQRQAERRLRLQSAALESAANAIAITNRFGRISWVNPAFTQLTGYTLDEAAGQTMRLLKSGQHDAAFYKQMWDTILTGQVWHGEVVNRRKDGSLYVEEQTITPVLDERGEISHFVCIKQDVTQRKQLEKLTQLEQARMSALVRISQYPAATPAELTEFALQQALALTESQAGYICHYDETAQRLALYTAVGDASIRHQLGRTAMWDAVIEQGKPILVNRAPSPADLPEQHIQLHRYLLTPVISEGRIVAAVGVANKPADYTDADAHQLALLMDSVWKIVERKRAELALKERTDQLQALRQVGLEITANLDLDSLLRSVVKRAVQLLRGSGGNLYFYNAAQDVLEQYATSDAHIHGGITLHRGEGVAGKILASGQPLMVDNYKQWEGRATVFEDHDVMGVAGAPIRWGDPASAASELLGVLIVWTRPPQTFLPTDVELLSMFATQAAIAIKNARLYQAEQEQYRRLQESQARLIHMEKMSALGRLTASVAHEINNPLQAVQSCLTLIQEGLDEGSDPADIQQDLYVAKSEVERIARIVQRLREFFRPARQGLQPTDATAVLESVIELTRKQLQHSNVTVEHAWTAPLPIVQANPDLLKQVFLNLVLNAIDAMPQGGTLRLTARPGQMQERSSGAFKPAVQIEVADTGIGLPPDRLSQIFEPFYTTKESGTGLGLSISYEIIQSFGGEIGVTSQPGAGTTFTIWLPASQPQT